MRKFFKNHWFGSLIVFFVLAYIAMIIIVVSSPRQDIKNRGFIPCTQKMMQEVIACKDRGQIICISKNIIKNSVCDAGVIFDGFKKWTAGEQERPWSNYFFVPEINNAFEAEENDEDLQNFYQQYPDAHMQIETLNSEYEKLNKKLEETEDEKLPQ